MFTTASETRAVHHPQDLGPEITQPSDQPFKALYIPRPTTTEQRSRSLRERMLDLPVAVYHSCSSFIQVDDGRPESHKAKTPETITLMKCFTLQIPPKAASIDICKPLISKLREELEILFGSNTDDLFTDTVAALLEGTELKKLIIDNLKAFQFKLNYYEQYQNKINYDLHMTDLISSELGIIRKLSEKIRVIKSDANSTNTQNDFKAFIPDLMRESLIICFTPETTDAATLENFLMINAQELKQTCSTEILHGYLMQLLNSEDKLTVFDRINEAAHNPKRDIRKFLQTLDTHLSSDKSISKPLRRINEFSGKVRDYFVYVYNNMTGQNQSFEQLQPFNRQKILECTGKAVRHMADNGLLLDKVEFYKEIDLFDKLLGRPTSVLKAVSGLKTSHRKMIADHVLNEAFRLPELIDIHNDERRHEKEKIDQANQSIKELKTEQSELETKKKDIQKRTEKTDHEAAQQLEMIDSRLLEIMTDTKKETEKKTTAVESIFRQAARHQERAICEGFERLIHEMLTEFSPGLLLLPGIQGNEELRATAQKDLRRTLSIFGFSTDHMQNLSFREQLNIRFKILNHFCSLYDEVTKVLAREEAGDLLTPVFSKVVVSLSNKLSDQLAQVEGTSDNSSPTDDYLKIMESEFLQAKANILNHFQDYQKEYMVKVAETLEQLDAGVGTKQKCYKRAAETVSNVAGKLDIRTSLSEGVRSYKDIDMKVKTQGGNTSDDNHVTVNLLPAKGGITFDEAFDIYKTLKAYKACVEKRHTPQDLVQGILREAQTGKVSRSRIAQISEWDSRRIEQALSSVGGWTRVTSALKNTVRGFSTHGFYNEIARETRSLRARENHRQCDLIKMDASDHQTLISLTQIALQHARLKLNDQYPNDERIVMIDSTISNMINRRQSLTDSGTCNPMDRFLEIFDAIVEESSSDETSRLREELMENFNSILQNFNRTAKENYIGMDDTGKPARPWQTLVINHKHQTRPFRDIFLHNIDQKNPEEAGVRRLLANVFDTYQQSLEHCMDSKLAHQHLPPAKETVRYLLMAAGLKSGATTSDQDNYKIYQFALSRYNDHIDAMAMQMADAVFNDRVNSDLREKDLDTTFSRVMDVAKNESMTKLAEIGKKFSEDKNNQEKLKALNEKLDELFNQHEFQRLFSKRGAVGKLALKTWNYMKKQQAFLPGFFVGCAVTSMIFTGTATELLKDIQGRSDKISTLIFGIKDIVDQLSKGSPGLLGHSDRVFTVSSNVSSTNCSDRMFNLNNSPFNMSLQDGLRQLETESQALQQHLRETDTGGCPSGGLKKFPPDANYNLANLITTVASIASGLAACLGGWYQEVKHRTHDVNHYSTIPLAFQSLPSEMTEALMLKTSQQFTIHNQDSDEIYPGLTAYSGLEKLKHGILDCIDFMICDPNPKIKGKKVWPIVYLLTLALRPASMAFQKRPHSYQELLTRLASAANSRIGGTLLRMGGYNTAKEFMDVFKSKAYMLGFLILLKELDMPIALNEKASISDYLTLRSMETKLSATLHDLQGQKRLDSAAITMLRNTYGDVLINSILGPDPDIQQLEQEVSTAWSCITHTVCGIAPMVAIYTLEALNLIWYTVSPISMAQQLLNKAGNIFNEDLTLAETVEHMFGKDSDVIKKMAEKARSTMKYDTTPRDMNDLELLCHYTSAGRSSEKVEQSTLLWGIKELINLSMYTNTALHERDMGIQSINWEALGAFIAYLIKDSTGIAARYAMLLDDETLRTLFSLLDKLDSPLAELAISKLGNIGLYCPQNIRNAIGDMMEEAVISSTGSVESIHEILRPKFDHLRKIGLPNLNRATKILADRIESTVLPMVQQLSEEQQGLKSAAKATEVEFFNDAIAKVREEMPKYLVSFGAVSSEETKQKMSELKQFCQTIGKYDSRPEALIGYLEQLMQKYTKEDIEAFLAEHIIHPLQSIDPAEKAELLKKHSVRILNARKPGNVITEQPFPLQSSSEPSIIPEIRVHERAVTSV